jgi:hypothetical protein
MHVSAFMKGCSRGVRTTHQNPQYTKYLTNAYHIVTLALCATTSLLPVPPPSIRIRIRFLHPARLLLMWRTRADWPPLLVLDDSSSRVGCLEWSPELFFSLAGVRFPDHVDTGSTIQVDKLL